MASRKFLFVCSRNRWRSPTAEALFATYPGVVAYSAGLAKDAEEVLSADLVEWADMVFVMERVHRTRLVRNFEQCLEDTPVIVLGIRDEFRFMDDRLVALLQDKMRKWLPPGSELA